MKIKVGNKIKIIKEVNVLGVNIKGRIFKVFKIFENGKTYASPVDDELSKDLIIEFKKEEYELWTEENF